MKTITNRWIVVLGVIALPSLACSPLGSLLGGGGGGTVANLWSDVPQMPGSQKIDAELPLPVRLFVEGMRSATNAQIQSEGEGSLEDFDFITYQTSGSPEEVAAFYTLERMQAEGWTATGEGEELGCTNTPAEETSVGAFCIFGQRSGDHVAALFVVAAPDEDSGQTRIYYMRLEGTGQ